MSHLLNLGDGIAGMAAMPDRSVDHVITDPPYEAEAHTLQRRVKRGGGSNGREGKGKGVMRIEALPFPPITEAERMEAGRQFGRIATRWVLVFCQVEASHKWRAALEAGGLVYLRTAVWVKPDGMPQYSGDRPGMGYESIVVAHAPCHGEYAWNGGGKHGVYIFNKIGDADRERTGHPTQKPLALIQQLVRDFTSEGELVCDPYTGSGTVPLACWRLGRRCVAWDNDPVNYEMARQRLATAAQQYDLLPSFKKAKQLPLSGPDREGAA